MKAWTMVIYATMLCKQVLYEIAFAFGSCGNPFNLYSIMPRQLIPYDGNFSGDVPLALVVEESEDAPEPCDYLEVYIYDILILPL